jgi:hypothetical protein
VIVTQTGYTPGREGSTVTKDEGKPLKEPPVEAGYY